MSIVQAQRMDAMIGGDPSVPLEWFAGCSLAFGRVLMMCSRTTTENS